MNTLKSLMHRSILSVLVLFGATCPLTFANEAPPQQSVMAARAPKALALDLVRLPQGRVLAVGERGHVLISDDRGAHWSQSLAPTLATLTSLAAAGDNIIAAGHDSVILRSTDAGEHWSLVNQDIQAEKPILDLFFADATHAFAIGAYGYFSRSTDAGLTWKAEEISAFELPDFGFPHLYRMTRLHDGALVIVGEAGFMARSNDAGNSWQRLPLPYDGALFSVMETRSHSLLLCGMRGHLFRSVDGGLSWQTMDMGVHSGLNNLQQDQSSGRIFMLGMDGQIFYSDDDGLTFMHEQRDNRKAISDGIALSATQLILAAEDGLSVHTLKTASAENNHE